MSSGEVATLINPFEVPARSEELFIGGWERAAEYLRAREGYLDAALHRALDPDAEFRFVNIAHWRSREAFEAAVRDPAFPGSRMPFTTHAALYTVIRRWCRPAASEPGP